jgi:CRP/FNR family transcriptional regulator
MFDLERAHDPLRHIPAGGPLLEQGARSDRSFVVLRGWVAVTHMSDDGRLVILRFVLPGDVLAFERQSGVNAYGAVAVGDVTVCSISRSRQQRLERDHPRFDALHRAAEAGTLKQAHETLASIMGHRASERVGHLLFQLSWRALRRRPSAGDRVDAPLSQIQIALATGLTPVHVSRTLRQLREDGVLELDNHQLTIHDPAGLARLVSPAPETMALWA